MKHDIYNMKITPEEFQQIRSFLKKKSGIVVAENKTYLVENRLIDLLPKYGCNNFGDLCSKAKQSSPQLAEEIVDQMTTNETLWFRDSRPFDVFSTLLLQQYISELKAKKRRKVRIWSAACSTGQEPYSIGMLICEALRKNSQLTPDMFEILATDISETCLKTALTGDYDRVAMGRGLAETLRDRYFVNSGKRWVISDDVKQLVCFKQFNLQDSFSSMGLFDIVFCRNVAIYFSPEFKTELYNKFATLLQEDGVLFVGAAESLSGYCDIYSINEFNGGYYYKVEK